MEVGTALGDCAYGVLKPSADMGKEAETAFLLSTVAWKHLRKAAHSPRGC